MKYLFAPAALLLLAGCGSLPAPNPVSLPMSAPAAEHSASISGLIGLIETATPAKLGADLDAATAYAAAQNDLLGSACYPSIKVWIASLPPLPAGKVASNVAGRPAATGAITAFEYARVDRRVVEGSVSAWQTQIQSIIAQGPPQALLLGCGGLVQDENNFFLRIAAVLGTGAATANIAPIVAPALPAIGAALPVPLP